jgi:hypothetical protein
MRLLESFFRRPLIADGAGLADFLDSRSAFLVQKSIIEYSRARAGLFSTQLFKEAAFRDALEVARWHNYPLCLLCAALMAEHVLRSEAGERAELMRGGVVSSVADVCRRYPVPPSGAPDFWVRAEERITRRVWQAGLAAPHPIKDIPKEIAKEFFAGLPIHADLTTFDFELITNNLRSNLCRAYEEFVAAIDTPVLVRALVAEQSAHAGGA